MQLILQYVGQEHSSQANWSFDCSGSRWLFVSCVVSGEVDISVPAEYASVPLHDALLARLSNDGELICHGSDTAQGRLHGEIALDLCCRDGQRFNDYQCVPPMGADLTLDLATSRSLVLIDEVGAKRRYCMLILVARTRDGAAGGHWHMSCNRRGVDRGKSACSTTVMLTRRQWYFLPHTLEIWRRLLDLSVECHSELLPLSITHLSLFLEVDQVEGPFGAIFKYKVVEGLCKAEHYGNAPCLHDSL